jgi:hypothetical protein
VRRLNGVRQPFNPVGRQRLEEQRAPTVGRQLEGNRNPLRSRILQSGNQGRQTPNLSLTAANRLTAQRRLGASVPNWTIGVLDCTVQGGRNVTSNPAPPEVIGSELMMWSGGGTNAAGKLRVEGRSSHEGKQPRNDQRSDAVAFESLCKWTGESHLEPFVERLTDADQTSRHT